MTTPESTPEPSRAVAELAADTKALFRELVAHTKSDEVQFAQLKTAITDGLAGVRGDLHALTEMIEHSLKGSTDRAGLIERIRVLERAEQNRKWVMGILLVAIVSLSLNELVGWMKNVTP